MKKLICVLLALSGPAVAQIKPGSGALQFVTDNKLDGNLYNLLAASIPNTDAGRAIFQACGETKTEMAFERGYKDVQDAFGVEWRHALADTYARHLSAGEMVELTNAGAEVIAERLSDPAIIGDLQETLTPVLKVAVATHVNSMIDVADEICAN